jgi:hypothetical protein
VEIISSLAHIKRKYVRRRRRRGEEKEADVNNSIFENKT